MDVRTNGRVPDFAWVGRFGYIFSVALITAGLVAIADVGHRTTFLAPFRHIDSMKPGDRITLEMPYGRRNFLSTLPSSWRRCGTNGRTSGWMTSTVGSRTASTESTPI